MPLMRRKSGGFVNQLEALRYNPDGNADAVRGRVVSTDPVITISKCAPSAPLGIAGVGKKVFRRKGALHILSNTWHSHRRERLKELAKKLKQLSRYLVDNHFVYLCNTQYEVWLVSRYNIPTFLSSELLAIDDSIFSPGAPPPDNFPGADAVYVARITGVKRHELAENIESLALVYGMPGSIPEHVEHMRRSHPHWIFVNHLQGNDEYKRLDSRTLAGVLNQCRVGLCLSAEEGAMRASMEYLLCGLPVVTTRSIGGRDRYFDKYNCIYADDTPASVASTVREMLARDPDREEIRQTVLKKMNYERDEFVSVINAIVKSIYGVSNLFDSYDPFKGHISHQSVDDFLKDLMGQD